MLLGQSSIWKFKRQKECKPFTNKFALHDTEPATLETLQVYFPESVGLTA